MGMCWSELNYCSFLSEKGVAIRDSLCFKKLLVDQRSTDGLPLVDVGKDRIG